MAKVLGITLKPFDGSDFIGWKQEVKFHLQALGLWKITTKKEREPEDEKLRGDFEARKEKAFGIINLSLPPKCRVCLSGMDSDDPAKEWE